MSEVEELELVSRVLKAKSAKAELRLKIAKAKEDIARMEDHSLKQDMVIEKAEKELQSK